MRLEKLEENEEVQHFNFLDFINCGACYLLAEWDNEKHVNVTLNKDTVLEDLSKEHGGSIYYDKFCRETFRLYESDNRSSNFSGNLNEVINYTKIDTDSGWYCRLLKDFITGGELEERPISGSYIVRWPNQKGGRGTHWYKLTNN